MAEITITGRNIGVQGNQRTETGRFELPASDGHLVTKMAFVEHVVVGSAGDGDRDGIVQRNSDSPAAADVAGEGGLVAVDVSTFGAGSGVFYYSAWGR